MSADDLVVEGARARFEEEVFKAHFLKSISKKNPNDQLMSCSAMTKAELCERDGDDYKRPEVSAMWFAWKLALPAARKIAFEDVAAMIAVRATMPELADYVTAELDALK